MNFIQQLKDVQTPKQRDVKRRKRVRGDEDEVNDKEGKTLETFDYFHSMGILYKKGWKSFSIVLSDSMEMTSEVWKYSRNTLEIFWT